PVETDRWHEECKQNPAQLYLPRGTGVSLVTGSSARHHLFILCTCNMAMLSLASHNFSSHVHGQVIKSRWCKARKGHVDERRGRSTRTSRRGPMRSLRSLSSNLAAADTYSGGNLIVARPAQRHMKVAACDCDACDDRLSSCHRVSTTQLYWKYPYYHYCSRA
ncbi:hypothetical protein BDU57DRAFT_567460, partial [Ampelomyces quisqualis]